jgi:hypothetical protein
MDLLTRRSAPISDGGREGAVLILGTKARDKGLTKLVGQGWPKIGSWPPDYAHYVGRRVILWPAYGAASTVRARHRRTFLQAIDGIVNDGAWTVYVDEAPYFVETLGLRPQLDELYNTARSSGITLLSSAQGVSWIPRGSTTQQSWLFVFRPRAGAKSDLVKAVADICGDRDRYVPAITTLDRHEFLIVHTHTGTAYRSRLPRPH